jgi:hypothetical protein
MNKNDALLFLAIVVSGCNASEAPNTSTGEQLPLGPGPALQAVGAVLAQDDQGFIIGIDASRSSLSDDHVVHLEKMPTIRLLNLSRTKITHEGFVKLSVLKHLKRLSAPPAIHLKSLKSMPRLIEALDLGGCQRLGDSDIRELGRMFPVLKELRLPPSITGKGLNELRDLRRLTILDIQECKISHTDLLNLPKLPDLEWIILPKETQETPVGDAPDFAVGAKRLRKHLGEVKVTYGEGRVYSFFKKD